MGSPRLLRIPRIARGWVAIIDELQRAAAISATEVGSGAGAVPHRSSLSVSVSFVRRCLTSFSIAPFPAPATSIRTGGFPASDVGASLICVMWRGWLCGENAAGAASDGVFGGDFTT